MAEVQKGKDLNANDMKDMKDGNELYKNSEVQDVLTSTPKPDKADNVNSEKDMDTSSVSSGKCVGNMNNQGKINPSTIERLEKDLEHEKKQRHRAEDWAQFLERELDAHIDARKYSDDRYFKLRRKLKIYKHNYNKLKEKYLGLMDMSSTSEDLNISRQCSVVFKQVSVEEVHEGIFDEAAEKLEKFKVEQDEKEVKEAESKIVDTKGDSDIDQFPPNASNAQEQESNTESVEHEIDIELKESKEAKIQASSQVPILSHQAPNTNEVPLLSENAKVSSPISASRQLPTLQVTSPVSKQASKIERILSTTELSDDEGDSKEESTAADKEQEVFLQTGARRLSVTKQSFDDINSAKNFWEKKYSVKPPPSMTNLQQPRINLGGSLGSAIDRKTFWEEKNAHRSVTTSHVDLSASLGNTEGKKHFWEDVSVSMRKPQVSRGAANTPTELTGRLKDKKDLWEDKLAHLDDVQSGSGADLDQDAIGQIQKTKLLWEEKMERAGTPETSGSRRRSLDSDEGINLSESGKIQMTKQMWEEISHSGVPSVSMSRRRSTDSENDENMDSFTTASLDLSSRSNLDLSSDSLTTIQARKALWTEAANSGDMTAIKAAVAEEKSDDGEDGKDQEDDIEPAPLARVGSIKLKKEMWENTVKRGGTPEREEQEQVDKEQKEQPGSFIRAGSLRMKKQLFEKNNNEIKNQDIAASSSRGVSLEKELETNVMEAKNRWRDLESGKAEKGPMKSRTVDRLTSAEEEALMAELAITSSDVKVESIRSVSSTKSKWEQIVSNDQKASNEKKKKRSSLARLTKADFKEKFSKWEDKSTHKDESNEKRKKGKKSAKVDTDSGNESSDSSSSDSSSHSSSKSSNCGDSDKYNCIEESEDVVANDDGNVANDDGNVAKDDCNVTNDDCNVTNDDGNVTNDDCNVTNDDCNVTNDDCNVTNDDGNVTNDDDHLDDILNENLDQIDEVKDDMLDSIMEEMDSTTEEAVTDKQIDNSNESAIGAPKNATSNVTEADDKQQLDEESEHDKESSDSDSGEQQAALEISRHSFKDIAEISDASTSSLESSDSSDEEVESRNDNREERVSSGEAEDGAVAQLRDAGDEHDICDEEKHEEEYTQSSPENKAQSNEESTVNFRDSGEASSPEQSDKPESNTVTNLRDSPQMGQVSIATSEDTELDIAATEKEEEEEGQNQSSNLSPPMSPRTDSSVEEFEDAVDDPSYLEDDLVMLTSPKPTALLAQEEDLDVESSSEEEFIFECDEFGNPL